MTLRLDESPAEDRTQGLDPDQRAAVTSSARILRILAPAGSGKTRVLTRRIAFREAEENLDPGRTLAVTFTRRAAEELRLRLRSLGLRDLPTAGTFHSVAFAQLRRHSPTPAKRSLLTRRYGLVKAIVSEVCGVSDHPTVSDVMAELDWASARDLAIDEYPAAAAAHGRRAPVPPTRIAEVRRLYTQAKARRGVMDFDDLLREAAQLLEDSPNLAEAVRWNHPHLFVDEFQDTNPLQFRLLSAWVGPPEARVDLCVVGDPRQAIYGWNGADADHLMHLERWYPDAETVTLRHNYRSTPEIVAVGREVLAAISTPTSTVSARPPGRRPHLVAHPTVEDEAREVARLIRDHRGAGGGFGQVGILVRTNAQTSAVAEALAAAHIPHRVRGGSSLLDSEGGRWILQRLRSIPDLPTALADLEEEVRSLTPIPPPSARDDLTPPRDPTTGEVGDPPEPEPPDPEPPDPDPDMNGPARTPPTSQTSGGRLPHRDTAENRSALIPRPATPERIAEASEVARMGREYLDLDPRGTGRSFAAWMATAVARDDAHGGASDIPAVDVVTFHAAKGLEWSVVHILGMERGLVPIASARRAAEKDEEGRLLHVAVTRARDELYLHHSRRRSFGGRVTRRTESPFLADVRRALDTIDVDAAGAPPDFAGLRSVSGTGGTRDPSARRLAALRDWRARQASVTAMPPAALVSDRVLRSLASLTELGPSALLEAGLSPAQVDRFGPPIRSLLAAEASPAAT